MNLIKVKSSNIAAVGWEAGTLRILFIEGASYDYCKVPSKLFHQLLEAKSKGGFFQEYINGKFKHMKVNPEKEGDVMAKSKQQRAAEERAQAAAPKAAQPVAVAEQPKPAPATAAPLPTPSKQTATLDKLKAAWTEKKVDLSNMTIKDDGKFKLIIVDAGWPTIRVGNSGGITVMELRSYANAFDAAVDGLTLYQKQQARDQKKVAQPAVAAAAPPAPTPAPAAKSETVTAKKAKAHAQIEQEMQTA